MPDERSGAEASKWISAPEPLCHLSTMALGELLEADLACWAKRVGTNDRLPTDERAQIDARELLGASCAKRRVRDVASRTFDGTEPAGPGQSADLGTTERWTASHGRANRNGPKVPLIGADFVLMKRLRSRRPLTPVDPLVQEEREAQFGRNIEAFIRREFDVIEETMRPDVALDMPGSSWLAGSYQGVEAVSRGVVALRQVFNSDKKLVTFLHEGDQMVVRHAIIVSGPRHEVQMNLGVRIGFDEQGKVATIDVEPADLDLFDYVVNSRLGEPTP
jgi:hypothetical protein